MAKETKYWGVYPFSVGRKSDIRRGYVCREAFADGRACDGYNYGGIDPIKVHKSRHHAERLAERMTFGDAYMESAQ